MYIISLWILFFSTLGFSMEKGFVDIKQYCPSILINADYATEMNFTGTVVRGYKRVTAITSKEAVEALCKVQEDALKQDLTIKIFDGYRPAKAVAYFMEWAKLPESNLAIKDIFYPKHNKPELFELGYIAKQSSHSRGSALDLTLAHRKTGESLDMGTHFDFFDDLSHTENNNITHEQTKNRQLLKALMEKHGFKNFSKEWWHYSLVKEPYPHQYFDFDVE